jgi:hypothetical protein
MTVGKTSDVWQFNLCSIFTRFLGGLVDRWMVRDIIQKHKAVQKFDKRSRR